MKMFYKIPSWLLGLTTVIAFFDSVEHLATQSYYHASISLIALFGLIYYTFIKIKD